MLPTLVKLKLTVFAEKLVAAPALQWLVGKLAADDALDLLDHLPLQLVLDLVHRNVQRRNGLGAHQVLNRGLGDNETQSLLGGKSSLLSVHLLLQRVVLPLLSVHDLDRHGIFYFSFFIIVYKL